MREYHHSTADLFSEEEIRLEVGRIETALKESVNCQIQLLNRRKEVQDKYRAIINGYDDLASKIDKLKPLAAEKAENMTIHAQTFSDQIQAMEDYKKNILKQVEMWQMRGGNSAQESILRIMWGWLEEDIVKLGGKREEMLNAVKEQEEIVVSLEAEQGFVYEELQIKNEKARIVKVIKEGDALLIQIDKRQKEINAEYSSLFNAQTNDPQDKSRKLLRLAVEKADRILDQAQLICNHIQAIEDSKKIALRELEIAHERNRPNKADEIRDIEKHLAYLEKEIVVSHGHWKQMLSNADRQKKANAITAERISQMEAAECAAKEQIARQNEQSMSEQVLQLQLQHQPQQQQMQQSMLREGVAGKNGMQSQLQNQTQSKTTANQFNNSNPSSTLFQNRSKSQIRSRSK